jgi:hypothetical protein
MIAGVCLHRYLEVHGGQTDRNVIIYSADDVKGGYPRTGGAHQTEGLETAPFHRLVLLAREHVYPDGVWNADTSPRCDDSVRPSKKAVVM